MAEPFEEVSPEIEKPEQGLTSLAGILISLLIAIIAAASVWGYYNYKVVPDLEKKASTTQITPSQESKASTSTTTLTPIKVVENFYKEYLASTEGVDGLKGNKYLSADLVTTLQEESTAQNADVVICAQDKPTTFSISEQSKTNSEAVEIIRTVPFDTTITVNLQLLEKQWKIVGILCPTE